MEWVAFDHGQWAVTIDLMQFRPMTALVVAVALLVSACATDGRELRDAQPWQTTTTRPIPATAPPPFETGRSGFTVFSPDFASGGQLPASATCAGGAVFPALGWTGVPDEAIELVVTLSDQTDPLNPVLLWLLAGVEPDLTGLDAGLIPVGAFETLNGFDNPGFGSPCLETMAEGPRDLQYRVYVLTQPSGILPGGSGNNAWAAVRNGAIDSASVLARIDGVVGG